MNIRTYLLLSAGLLTASPAAAQSAQSTAGLEEASRAGSEVIVTANRAARPAETVGQAVTVLDTETIERRQASVVTDLLRQTPGVTIARNGGVGGVASVFIRGAESDQTVALIDGVKLNDPSSPGGGFNFGELLIGNIARIEVLRGAQSVLWGSQAIGGVVNLITRQPTEQLAVNARAEGGWHGTGQGFANVSGKVGPASLSLGGGYFTTDNISAYARGSERDGFRNYGANGSANIALVEGVSVDVRGFYADSKSELDGFPPPNYTFADTRDYQTSEQWVGYTGLNVALLDGRFTNRIGYAHTEVERRNIDRSAGGTETFRSRGLNDRIEYQGNLEIDRAVRATFGAERELSRARTANYGFADAPGRARLWSGYAQVAVTPVTGLTATGGVRHDDHNRFGGATTASGSAAYTPNGGATVVRGSYSEGFKAPTLFQLGSDYGNQLLRPERSHGWDAGVSQKALGGAIEASATYFERTSTNLITFISCPAQTGICVNRPFGTYDNVVRARVDGVELALTLRPVEAFTVSGAATFLDADNRSAGASYRKDLARRPGSSVTVNADYRWGFGLSTGATVTAVGDSFDNAANTRRLDGYALVDLRASFPIGRHLEVYGRVENLFDEGYQTVADYGQPGRAGYGGVRVRF